MTTHRSHTKKHLAARIGSWSARNTKKAIFGWLAFILLAAAIGGAVGTKQMDDSAGGAGDSGRADQIIADKFPDHASESILIQAKDAGARQAAIADVERTVKRFDVDMKPKDVSKDGQSVLVQYELPGDDESDAVMKANEPIEAAITALAGKHDDAFVG